MKNLSRSVLLLLAGLLSCSLAMAETYWIDVRTAEEHAQDSIPGDIHIPHEQIASRIDAVTKDKQADIHLYCRSGRRAGIAADTLKSLGYQQVTNEGTIDDARKKRGLTKP